MHRSEPANLRLSRRRAVAGLGGLAAASLLGRPIPNALAQTGTPTPATPRLAASIGDAAATFLASLDGQALARATYPFADPERQRWHWTVLSSFPRNGLPLNEMSEEQRELALALLQASLSDAGYRKDRDIMALQGDLGNDPDDYYVTIFGTPAPGRGAGDSRDTTCPATLPSPVTVSSPPPSFSVPCPRSTAPGCGLWSGRRRPPASWSLP